ncbi:Trk system potassium uptake protein TrkA [Mucinivorans hirudinis]|uniref:Trk system potassium uptake protein TrkA n=1 Tax=Mucinivorans hirudinis TaxID=1433126 RepID=A0A060R7J5_9BACT|nr:Trk system potassium uptake protein TrkA [Mucinivorans hirudinis]
MKIVVAGAGEVGSHLAKMLSAAGHDVTAMDWEEQMLEKVAESSDIITIEGDITSFETLKRAEVSRCDLFMAVSFEENTNILSAVLAKQLGARKVICRIDNDEYLMPGNKEVFINMGIDYLFYPEKVAAQEVVTLLGHTSTTEYIDFSGGKLIVVAFKLESSSPLVGKTLEEVTIDRDQLEYRTIAISRESRTIIPTATDFFKEGDMIYVISEKKSNEELMKLMGKSDIPIRNIMIMGGSRIARRIARMMQNDVNIKIIDYKADKAYKLAEELDKTLVIHEDGRKTEAMIEEGLQQMDAYIALTGRSETNILAAMVAKKLGVKKVIAEVENLNYIGLAESVGIDTIINKKLITASSIYGFTMSTDVQAIKCLNGCDAEVLEFIVKADSPVTKGKIKHINFPRGAVIGGVVRGDKSFIALGSTELRAYDRVVVFALPEAIRKVGKFFA